MSFCICILKFFGFGMGAFIWRRPLSKPPEQTVAFTIAVIALGAKMAKADGVTRSEVQAFNKVSHSPEALDQAARAFDLARQDVPGYEHYAKRIGVMFGAVVKF